MPSLEYSRDALDALDKLYDEDEDSAALINVLLEELETQPKLLDELCRPGNRHLNEPPFEIKRFQEMWRNRYTVYILKIRRRDGSAIERRVIYAHHPQCDCYYVLALMKREIDYEADAEFIERICKLYEDYGIPRY